MFCENCGKKLSDSAVFCSGCGTKTEVTAMAEAQPAAPPPSAPPPEIQEQPASGAPATAQVPLQQYQPAQVPLQQGPYAPPSPSAQQQYAPSAQQQYAPSAQQYQPSAAPVPPQQYQPTPVPPQQGPYSPVSAVPPRQKKAGWLLAYRIAASVIAVALIASGIYGLIRKPGGDGGGSNSAGAAENSDSSDSGVAEIARGDSATAEDGVIELSGVKLDFLGSGAANGARMTELDPAENQRPDGMISGLFEVELEAECATPVTLRIPINESAVPNGGDAEVLLAVGSRFDGDGGPRTTYIYIPATVADGSAGATFVPANFLQGLVADGAAGGRATPFTRVFTCYIAVKRVHYFVIDETEPGHYIDGPIAIYSPYEVGTVGLDELDFRDACQSDLTMMTEVYLLFQEYASQSFNARTVWPLQVYYDPDFRGARYELSTIRYEGGDSGQLFWNGNPADGIIRIGRDCWDGSGRYNLKARFAHEFCHFLMAGFVSNYNEPRWAKEAFAGFGAMAIGGVWDAEVMSNYHLLFNGLLPKTNSDDEGYARALLLWYIADLQKEASDTPMELTAMRNFAPIVSQTNLESANRSLDELLSVNKELYVYRFFRWLVGWPDDLFGIGHGGPSYFYSEALYGNLGQTLYCDLPDPDDEEQLNVGHVTLPVNYCGAQFAAVSFSDELIDELREVSEVVFEITSRGNCFMDVYEIDPNGDATPSVSGTQFVTSRFMEKISEGYTYLVMVVGLEAGSAPTNYTISVRVVGEEDVVGTYYGPYVRDVNIDRLHSTPMGYMTMVVERIGGDDSDTYHIRMFGEMLQEIRVTVTYDPETKMYTGRMEVNYELDPYYYYFNIEFSVENGTMTGRWFHTVIEVIQPRCFELVRIDL